MMDDIASKIQKDIDMSLTFFERKNTFYYTYMEAQSLVDLFINVNVLQNTDYLNKVHKKVNEYFTNFSLTKLTEFEKTKVLNLKYILSILNGNTDKFLIKDYALNLSEYFKKNISITKSHSESYEKLVLIFIEAQEFKKAVDICEQYIALQKNKTFFELIFNFIKDKQEGKPTDIYIKPFETILKKKKKELNSVTTDYYVYYSVYYREFLKQDNYPKAFSALYYGI
jgi:hypothetical protein